MLTPFPPAIQYSYVLAFEPTFIDIRHVETGAMAQIIQSHHLRLLFADMPPSATNSAATSMGGGSQLGHGANTYGQQQQPGYNSYNQYAPYAQQQRPHGGDYVRAYSPGGRSTSPHTEEMRPDCGSRSGLHSGPTQSAKQVGTRVVATTAS
jgi:hypothetical protein